jgi:Cd2+/Zn2+-exporting ATPase
MSQATMKRFKVRNLDCAACAAKLETKLQHLDGVEEAVLDFAGSVLHIKAKDTAPLQAWVHKIEPGVELVAFDETTRQDIPESGYPFKRELILLAIAFGLILIHLLFGKSLQAVWPGLEYGLMGVAYLLVGWNVLAAAFRTLLHRGFFDENVLMTIATMGAIAIHALSEAVGVMLFYKIGEMLQERAVSRSRRSVGALLTARPDQAMVQSLTGLVAMRPEQVDVGQIILVKPGEKIPLDGEVRTGASQLDTSPLTGESRPQKAHPGSHVLAGAINLTGALTISVTRLFKESSIVKILDMVQNAAARKAKTEKFITTFARYYTPAVVLAAAMIAILPPLLTEAEFKTWIYRALVLLVISCPCALVISIPLGYFGGIGQASRQGILVKGSNFLDALAHVKTVVFDKTGTLTRGVFEVEEVVTANDFSKSQLLSFAAAAEIHSTHPIGASIVKAHARQVGKLDASEVTDHTVIPGCGIRARWRDREIVVGNDALLHSEMIAHDTCVTERTVAHVTVDGKYAGYILIGDHLKPHARQAMDELRAHGVKRLSMLTGDNHCMAEQVAQALRLDDFHASLLPEEKVRLFEQIASQAGPKEKVAFVGDGINDAPVLARADVGVAMGALGSDAAIETADVVLMTDSPLKIAEAISIARRTRRIVWQNIVMALTVKGVFVILGTFGLATMWEAVFADMGTAVAAVLNATRAMK